MSANPPAPLVPIEQRSVDFHGEQLTAVLGTSDNDVPIILVPVKPLVEYLGLDWRSQRHRIQRDPVLSEVAQGVVIMTPPSPTGRGGGRQRMLALPVEFLHGWLFGVDVSRARPELRDKLTTYRREVFGVLWNAFQAGTLGAAPLPVVPSDVTTLAHVRATALAVAALAEQQLALGERVTTAEGRLDRAALVVTDLGHRLDTVQRTLSGGELLTEAQTMEVSQAVKALAMLLAGQELRGRNPYQAVFDELYRRFGVTSYKNIPVTRYCEVMSFLEDWRKRERHR
jgi:hypothetical protein